MSLNENYVKIKVHGRACQHCDHKYYAFRTIKKILNIHILPFENTALSFLGFIISVNITILAKINSPAPAMFMVYSIALIKQILNSLQHKF